MCLGADILLAADMVYKLESTPDPDDAYPEPMEEDERLALL